MEKFDDAGLYTASLLEVAGALGAPHTSIQPLEPGMMNGVVRIDDTVLKSPRVSNDEYKERIVRAEAAVVEILPPIVQLATGTEVKVPQLRASRPDNRPPYNIFSFVPGEILAMSDIMSLSEPEKLQLGEDLGSFVARLARCDFSADALIRLQNIPVVRKTGAWLLEQHRLPYIGAIRHNGCFQVAELVGELAHNPHPPGDEAVLEPIPGHGDLRPANLTFHKRRLVGVFDFGSMYPRDPAEELRWTCFMGEAVMRAAASQYTRETQTLLTPERIAHFANMQAVATAAFCAIHPDKGKIPLFQRNFLSGYYPARDLTELDRFTDYS